MMMMMMINSICIAPYLLTNSQVSIAIILTFCIITIIFYNHYQIIIALPSWKHFFQSPIKNWRFFFFFFFFWGGEPNTLRRILFLKMVTVHIHLHYMHTFCHGRFNCSCFCFVFWLLLQPDIVYLAIIYLEPLLTSYNSAVLSSMFLNWFLYLKNLHQNLKSWNPTD